MTQKQLIDFSLWLTAVAVNGTEMVRKRGTFLAEKVVLLAVEPHLTLSVATRAHLQL